MLASLDPTQIMGKIIDFGTSQEVPEGEFLMACTVEMPTYLPPEILEKKPFDTRGTRPELHQLTRRSRYLCFWYLTI